MKQLTAIALALTLNPAFAQSVQQGILIAPQKNVMESKDEMIRRMVAEQVAKEVAEQIARLTAAQAQPPAQAPQPIPTDTVPACVGPVGELSPYIGGPFWQQFAGSVDFNGRIEFNAGRISRTNIDNIQFYPHTDNKWNYSRLRSAADVYLAKWKCTGTGTFITSTTFRWN